MKNKKKIIILLIGILFITTGCTKTLVDDNKKAVTYKEREDSE